MGARPPIPPGCSAPWTPDFAHPRLLRVRQRFGSHSRRGCKGWLIAPHFVFVGGHPPRSHGRGLRPLHPQFKVLKTRQTTPPLVAPSAQSRATARSCPTSRSVSDYLRTLAYFLLTLIIHFAISTAQNTVEAKAKLARNSHQVRGAVLKIPWKGGR